MAVLTNKDGNPSTWLDATIEALAIIGHPANLQDIYDTIISEIADDTSKSKDSQATMRNAIYTNTADSVAGKNGKNIFFRESKGVWGLVDSISQGASSDISDDPEFPEGETVLSMHLRHERNVELVRKAKKRFADTHGGQLYCEICHFNFEEVYGKVGKGFIEAHHIKPVANMKPDDKTRVEDLVMLCPNCHRMVHRIRPWIDNKDDLQSILIRK